MNRIRFSPTGAALAIAAGCMSVAAGAAGAPPPKPTAAPAAQQMPQDDPAKVAQAKQFLLVFHPNIDPKNLTKKLDKFMPRMIARAKEENPKLDVKKFEAEKRAQIIAQSAQQLDFQSHVVSRHFSMQELKALTAFYGSPLGLKLYEEVPKIGRDLRLLRPLKPGGGKKPMTIRPMDDEKPAPAKTAPAPHK